MANLTVAIAKRWLELLADKIGESKIVLLDLYLGDGRTFRVRPDEVLDEMFVGSGLDSLISSWLDEHRLDPH
jgi:hypothetical protein